MILKRHSVRLTFALLILLCSAVLFGKSSVKMTYIANEGFLIEANQKKIIVDGLFDTINEGWCDSPSSEMVNKMKQGLPPFDKIDLIAVSHRHRDHFSKDIVIASLLTNRKTQLICPKQVLQELRSHPKYHQFKKQIRAITPKPFETEHTIVSNIRVDVFHLAHGRYMIKDPKSGKRINKHRLIENNGYIFDIGGKRIFHSGDSNPDSREFTAFDFLKYQVDIALLDRVYLGIGKKSIEKLQHIFNPAAIIFMHLGPKNKQRFIDWFKNNKLITVFKNKLETRDITIPSRYMGLKPPGPNAKLFMPGKVSSGFHDMNISISPDLKEILFTRSSPYDWFSTIIQLRYQKGLWGNRSLPVFIRDGKCRVSYPFISPDGKSVFYNTNQAIPGLKESRINNIWVAYRRGEKWTEGKPVKGVNTSQVEMYPSVSANGTLYFAGNYNDSLGGFDIYVSRKQNGNYAKAENLGAAINSDSQEFHAYIAPDESYLIFDRMEKNRTLDLYISFRKSDGTWTKAINMGKRINTENESELRPYVSPDGQFLFFSSTRKKQKFDGKHLTYDRFMKRIEGPGNGSQDLYWIEAGIIDELRKKVYESLK